MVIDCIYCQIMPWTVLSLLLILKIDAGHPIQSPWIVPGAMQCMKPVWIYRAASGMIHSGKKNHLLSSDSLMTFWVMELQRQSRVAHYLWCGWRPVWRGRCSDRVTVHRQRRRQPALFVGAELEFEAQFVMIHSEKGSEAFWEETAHWRNCHGTCGYGLGKNFGGERKWEKKSLES